MRRDERGDTTPKREVHMKVFEDIEISIKCDLHLCLNYM